MPVLPSWLTEPLWGQFADLLPERPTVDPTHPLGCHRRRISDRIIFGKLLQLLRFGCSYQAIADTTCSATTIRNRRDEWIRLGVFARLKQIALESYDRIVGLLLDQIAIDGSITKAPGGGEAAGRSRVDRGKQGMKRSGMTDGYGIPLGRVLAGANRHDSPLLTATLDRLKDLRPLPDHITVHLDAGNDSDKTRTELATRGLYGRMARTRVNRRRSRPASYGTPSAPTPGRTPSTGSPAATNAAQRSSTPSSTLRTPSPSVA
nr:hypothetical protein StreXyl84_64220 [Streptomyces sp. Xyl84]